MGFNGTSAATPYVSGVAALLKSYQPELVGEDMEQVLRLTTTASQPFDIEVGHGLINARRALDFVGPLKTMAHWIIGQSPFSVGPIAVLDSQLVQVDFKNHPSMPDTNDYSTSCMRYRLQGAVSWPFPFAATPKLWVRASGTLGWRDTSTYDHCFEVPWARVLPVGPQNATYTTYVYRVRDKLDTTRTIGWFPTEPANARIALTVIGTPGVAGVSETPGGSTFSLRISPNPVTARVKFAVSTPGKSRVKVTVLDVSGRRVAIVADAEFPAGANGVEWSGRNSIGSRCPAGVYFCRVETGRLSTSQRFVVLGGRP